MNENDYENASRKIYKKIYDRWRIDKKNTFDCILNILVGYSKALGKKKENFLAEQSCYYEWYMNKKNNYHEK